MDDSNTKLDECRKRTLSLSAPLASFQRKILSTNKNVSLIVTCQKLEGTKFKEIFHVFYHVHVYGADNVFTAQHGLWQTRKYGTLTAFDKHNGYSEIDMKLFNRRGIFKSICTSVLKNHNLWLILSRRTEILENNWHQCWKNGFHFIRMHRPYKSNFIIVATSSAFQHYYIRWMFLNKPCTNLIRTQYGSR